MRWLQLSQNNKLAGFNRPWKIAAYLPLPCNACDTCGEARPIQVDNRLESCLVDSLTIRLDKEGFEVAVHNAGPWG